MEIEECPEVAARVMAESMTEVPYDGGVDRVRGPCNGHKDFGCRGKGPEHQHLPAAGSGSLQHACFALGWEGSAPTAARSLILTMTAIHPIMYGSV